MDARILLACGLLLVVAQISGSPCTVCDGNGGEDVCSCAQQVVRPPLVLPPRRRVKKPKTQEPKCSCQKEYVELSPVYLSKPKCSCQKNQHSNNYEDSPQNYKYPQNYDSHPQPYGKPYQSYDKPYQSYYTPTQHDDQDYLPYDQEYQPYDQSNEHYGKMNQQYAHVQHHYDDYSENSYFAPSYHKDDDDDDDDDDNYDDDDDDDGHHIYKRSLGAYGSQGQQRPLDEDEGVSYYPVGGSGRVGVDATSRMLARQLEKTRGKSVKEDGLIFGPRTLPVDGEVKPAESNVNEGGLQEYDKEVLELKSRGSGFSEEDENGGDVVDNKKLITYSQIGYQPSDARTPEFLRRVPAKPQLPQLRRSMPQPNQYPSQTVESAAQTSQDGYHDEFPHHHEHFQRFIKRIQEAHKTAKKPYFGEKKYY